MKKYIIHLPESTERDFLVKDIIDKTGAEVFPAIKANNGAEGCFLSHLELYKKDPDEPLVVFEDDCEIIDSNILDLVKQYGETHDIIYFGVIYVWVAGSEPKIIKNFVKSDILNSWGTHAMWISTKARRLFLEYYDNDKEIYKLKPVDHVWNDVQNKYNLKVWRPSNIFQHCKQKIEFKSTIQSNNLGDFYIKDLKKACLIRSFRRG
jgi:GR25 family glycosyltransferase involved in LPS biosynthesis